MCGIAGFVDFKKLSTEEHLKKMTNALSYRGPDDFGYSVIDSEKASVGLGHRRLSILDLSLHGHQPMIYKNITLIYNGEIYNFREIRRELEQAGYSFYSESDTEVLIKGWHRWGAEVIKRCNGMFAFAVFDSADNSITFVRDRAGVKPLYWYRDNDLILFSSELKSFHMHPAFKKEICFGSLSLFLQYGYIPQPHSIFRNTFKLKAGHILRLDLSSNSIEEVCYWDVINCYREPKLDVSEGEAIDETEKLLKSACEYRMVSDVPVGIFLSGGYDSSIVTAILQSGRADKLKTFSIGFHEKSHNEAEYAKVVAKHLGTDHTEYYCTPQDALNIIPRIPEIWDEPFGDVSAIPTTLVSELARKQVSVSLSADGGDELFGGYGKYIGVRKKMKFFGAMPRTTHPFIKWGLLNPLTHKIAEKLNFGQAEERLTRFSHMLDADEIKLLSLSSSAFMPEEIKHLLHVDYLQLNTSFDEHLKKHWLDNLLAVDYKTYQADCILTKVDRATMSCGLEGREPLLDYRLIEYVSRLPADLKIRNGDRKFILKKITHKYIPQGLMDRPKMGFGVPIFKWFREELKPYLHYYLGEERLMRAGIFNVPMVVGIRDGYLAGKEINISRLWYILMFEMWREKWMN